MASPFCGSSSSPPAPSSAGSGPSTRLSSEDLLSLHIDLGTVFGILMFSVYCKKHRSVWRSKLKDFFYFESTVSCAVEDFQGLMFCFLFLGPTAPSVSLLSSLSSLPKLL